MAGFDYFSMMAGRLLVSTPTLLVMVGGVVLCLIGQSRPMRVRVLVGIAIAIQMFNIVVMPIVMQAIISAAQQGGSGVAGVSTQMSVLSLFASSASAVALSLLLWAAFTRDESSGA